MSDPRFIVIGGGIVGLSTAYRIGQRHPGATITVVEKEPELALHQTGRNSGVIHSGLYYTPGSLKARTCRDGRAELLEFVQQHGIAHELCGKVVVATSDDELPRLDALEERGRANGVSCVRIGPERLREIEPHAAGIAALEVHDTGIVDFVAMCSKLAELIAEGGGKVRTAAPVETIRTTGAEAVVVAGGDELVADVVVNCAGLHSDRVTALSGMESPAAIVPFRGEYYELVPEARHLCRTLIYPVPDPAFPFLGVHVTKMVDGGVECGPNAVLALAREGYRWRDIDRRDLWEVVSSPAFLKLARRYWRTGMGEMWRSASKGAFVKALQRLVPELEAKHLEPAPAGVRAQALAPDGALLDDFAFAESDRVVNVVNAPSPAATAALAIGSIVADRVEHHLSQS
ncbi:MAG: L-2-hydroxyglutarate oxidase [Actinomycetota bacterium]